MATTTTAATLSPDHRPIFEFIVGTGIRLRADSLTIAFASVYCHRVLRQKTFPADQICPFTMAAACVLVAGKVTNDAHVNTRDVMNVSYSILHADMAPLEIGDLSYALREGLVEMELVVLRFLRFRLNFEHPHQDLILMVRLLRDWYPNTFGRRADDVCRVSAMFLQDLYAQPQIVLDHKPRTLAVAILSMALSALRLADNIVEQDWAPTFMPSYDVRHIGRIKRKIVDKVYNNNEQEEGEEDNDGGNPAGKRDRQGAVQTAKRTSEISAADR
uniref:Cyclin N-terminal domain-containing protein n=1 Tax=Globodera rostochiensis TaxID=31243 RepID=A0A914HSK5_GLORO